jgi:hypothetical protein
MGIGIFLAAAGQAWAATCPTTDYCSSNGSESFPGTYAGIVGTGSGDINEIGNLSLYNGGSGGAFVNVDTANPSIYSFYWAGGILDIQGEVGNNGTVSGGIDMELYSLGSTDTGSGSEIGYSLYFPKSGTPEVFQNLDDTNLAAGYYAIDTYAGEGSTTGDPNYQIDLTPGATVTPEPSSLLLFGTGLLGLAFVAFRKAKAVRRGILSM